MHDERSGCMRSLSERVAMRVGGLLFFMLYYSPYIAMLFVAAVVYLLASKL